ncbi:peptidoglycan DD-metalloendopeptidase family protein [Micromonospora sp. NPDC051925]|uniref:M23 family metallopeptidase n=1 Tax=Micromonospora sp. NPDC051925 TaxID=3364288 RepID=UPI0037C5C5EE
MRRRRWSVVAAALLITGALVPASPAWAAPTFKVPFPCDQSWSGQTRSDHSPAYAVDFNRTDDLGDPVVASAPGTVDRVTDLGGTSYGKYVRIDHGGGYTTYYAHLNGFNVSVGQSVGYGKVIGWVGSTGGSTGPHLHYTYGTSSIWDRIGSGRFIADAYVYTGHDGYIPNVPRC